MCSVSNVWNMVMFIFYWIKYWPKASKIEQVLIFPMMWKTYLAHVFSFLFSSLICCCFLCLIFIPTIFVGWFKLLGHVQCRQQKLRTVTFQEVNFLSSTYIKQLSYSSYPSRNSTHNRHSIASLYSDVQSLKQEKFDIWYSIREQIF